jgi:hypothetical protein
MKMRLFKTGVIMTVLSLVFFPIAGKTEERGIEINAAYAMKAVLAGVSNPLYISVYPPSAEVHVSAEGPFSGIEYDNEDLVTVHTIEGTSGLVTVTVTADWEGKTVDGTYTFNVVKPAEPEPNAPKQVLGSCDFNDATGAYVGMMTFTYNPQTVDNIVQTQGPGYWDALVSTTRKLTSMEENIEIFGEPHSNPFVSVESDTWYGNENSSVLDTKKPGNIWHSAFGSYDKSEPGSWSNSGRYVSVGNMSFTVATNEVASGSWDFEAWDYEVGLKASGTFDCTLRKGVNSCGGTSTLQSNQWHQISLPCHPGAYSHISDVFINMPGIYDQDWVVYDFDASEDKYAKLNKDDSLEQGKGYWVIQKSDRDVTLSMPQGSVPTPTHQLTACSSPSGCIEIPLATKNGKQQWNMVGYPYDKESVLSAARITSQSPGCATQTGCNLKSAKTQGIVHNQLLNWIDANTGYKKISSNDTLDPWNVYWSVTLPKANNHAPIKLLLPKP